MVLLPRIADGRPVQHRPHRRGVLGRRRRHRRTIGHLHHPAGVTARTCRHSSQRRRLGARLRRSRTRGLGLPVLVAAVALTRGLLAVFAAIAVTLAVRPVSEIVRFAVVVGIAVFEPVPAARAGQPTGQRAHRA